LSIASHIPARIVLADDHILVRNGIRSLLRAVPEWEVCGEAGDGKEAVQKALECNPDVMLMDISMPNVNGIEATRQIRCKLPTVKIIMLTMHDSLQISEQAMRAGADAVVIKTSSPEDLVGTIDKVLENHNS